MSASPNHEISLLAEVMTRQAREQQAALLGTVLNLLGFRLSASRRHRYSFFRGETWALWLCFVSDCRKETGGEWGSADLSCWAYLYRVHEDPWSCRRGTEALRRAWAPLGFG